MASNCCASKIMRRSIAETTAQFSDLLPFRPGFDLLPLSTRIRIIRESILTMNGHLDHCKIRVRESPCHCKDCGVLFSSEFVALGKIMDELFDMLVETSSETSGRTLKRRQFVWQKISFNGNSFTYFFPPGFYWRPNKSFLGEFNIIVDFDSPLVCPFHVT